MTALQIGDHVFVCACMYVYVCKHKIKSNNTQMEEWQPHREVIMYLYVRVCMYMCVGTKLNKNTQRASVNGGLTDR